MTDTRDWADAAANAIYDDHKWDGDGSGMVDAIAAALRAAARVQPGHVRTDDGTERKVLGTLPVTADGCVVGDYGKAYIVNPPHNTGIFCVCTDGLHTLSKQTEGGEVQTMVSWYQPTSRLYSTRAAAEAAKKGGG